jgi:hypothetical protein
MYASVSDLREMLRNILLNEEVFVEVQGTDLALNEQLYSVSGVTKNGNLLSESEYQFIPPNKLILTVDLILADVTIVTGDVGKSNADLVKLLESADRIIDEERDELHDPNPPSLFTDIAKWLAGSLYLSYYAAQTETEQKRASILHNRAASALKRHLEDSGPVVIGDEDIT